MYNIQNILFADASSPIFACNGYNHYKESMQSSLYEAHFYVKKCAYPGVLHPFYAHRLLWDSQGENIAPYNESFPNKGSRVETLKFLSNLYNKDKISALGELASICLVASMYKPCSTTTYANDDLFQFWAEAIVGVDVVDTLEYKVMTRAMKEIMSSDTEYQNIPTNLYQIVNFYLSNTGYARW